VTKQTGTEHVDTHHQSETRPGGGWAIWCAGFVVAIGAGVLTAHGSIAVALGCGVPVGIAWLYPVITDGLALVAYAATRLRGAGRGYAWSVVVLAAGLSAAAQATFLAGGLAAAGERLRFVVGAWPAVAAAIAAHLLYLISTAPATPVPSARAGDPAADAGAGAAVGVQPGQVDHHGGVQNDHHGPPLVDQPRTTVRRVVRGVQPVQNDHVRPVQGVQSCTPGTGQHEHPGWPDYPAAGRVGGLRPALSPRDRALALAELQRRRTGALPSVRELGALAEVAQGTAATVLQELRESATSLQQAPSGLHLVEDQDNEGPEA
jgi:hypothetical protein